MRYEWNEPKLYTRMGSLSALDVELDCNVGNYFPLLLFVKRAKIEATIHDKESVLSSTYEDILSKLENFILLFK